MIQPFSFLLVSKAFREIQAGETLEILLGGPNAVTDLLKILPPSSYVMLLMEKCQGNDDGIRLQLKKTTVPKVGTGFPVPENQSNQLPKESDMTNPDLTTINVSSTVDARGSACPGPLLEAKKGIGKVKVGEVLEIYSSDSGTRNDIPAWAKKVGHEYIGLLEVDGYDKHFVRRKK